MIVQVLGPLRHGFRAWGFMGLGCWFLFAGAKRIPTYIGKYNRSTATDLFKYAPGDLHIPSVALINQPQTSYLEVHGNDRRHDCAIYSDKPMAKLLGFWCDFPALVTHVIPGFELS